MKVISKKHGVINTVTKYRFDELMKTGEYDEYISKEVQTKETQPEKRKRRTTAEMEASRAAADVN